MNDIRLAIYHPDETARAGVAARLRGALVVPSAGIEDCDAVICSPAPDEAELAIGHHQHVLIAAWNCPLAEIEELVARARKLRVQCSVVNPDRYLPSRQIIRKQLGGPLGEPGLIRSHRWEPSARVSAEGLPDQLIRDLDVALWLADRMPNRVFAVEQKNDTGRYVQLHLGFPSGGMALLDYSNALPPGDGYSSLSVIASTGAAYADDHQNAQLLYRGGGAQALRIEERAAQLAAMAQEFIDALRDGRDLNAGIDDWRRVFAVVKVATKSLATGRAVTPEALS